MRDALRILFVTPYVPSLLRVRPYGFIKHLARRGHRLTVLAARGPTDTEADAEELKQHCERVETISVSRATSLWSCVRGLPTGTPLQALYSSSPALRRRLCLELDGRAPYDVVHIEHLRAAELGLGITAHPVVYDSVDCISRLFEHALQMASAPSSRMLARLDLRRTRRYEAMLMGQFGRVLASSDSDSRALASLPQELATAQTNSHRRAQITVLPNGVDLSYFAPAGEAREPRTVVFVGRMSYHANVTAARHLLSHVMPLVWAQCAEARLAIVGPDPPRELRNLARGCGGRVTVTGYVPDVRPHLARAAVSVSPLVYAAGIQNKVLEAMAMGTPVVATPAGATALQIESGTHALLASDPAQLAGGILSLFADADLRRRLAAGGRRYVEAHHDWTRIAARLEAIYREEIEAFRRRCTSEENAR